MDTVAHFYFDFLDSQRRCFEIKGYREFEVTDLKSTPVRVYNYYYKGELAVDHGIKLMTFIIFSNRGTCRFFLRSINRSFMSVNQQIHNGKKIQKNKELIDTFHASRYLFLIMSI